MEILFPPYKRLVWDYTNANIEAINLAKETFNQENAFDSKYIHVEHGLFNEIVALLNETVLNIFSNFIPNRRKTFTYSH